MYNSLIMAHSYLAEINLAQAPAAGQKIKFQDIPILRDNAATIGLECFDVNTLTVSSNGATMVANVTGLVLTLAIGNTEEFVQIPCYTLQAANNGGLIREFNRLRVNLTKSYITILDATGLNAGESVCFNFYYNKIDKNFKRA